MFKISDRASKKFNELRSLARKGSYKTKDDKVKKSTSRYLGISNSFNREFSTQSGKFWDRCLLTVILNFLNFVLDNLRKRIRLAEFQLISQRKTI